MMKQGAVQRWFDATYASKGLSYLRPPAFYRMLVQTLGTKPGQTLLDVGCGPGLLLVEAEAYGLHPYGVDFSTVALKMARERAPRACIAACNAEALCFRDNTFDHVISIGVVEHFLHPDRAFAEMRRVARDDAQFCLLVPNSRSLRRRLHVTRTASGRSEERVATLEEWSRIFRQAGFAIERVYPDDWLTSRLRRFFPGRGERFAMGRRPKHLIPIRYAAQFFFILRH